MELLIVVVFKMGVRLLVFKMEQKIILNPKVCETKSIKILAGLMLFTMMIGFASAGLFDFLSPDKELEIEKERLVNKVWIKTITKINKWTASLSLSKLADINKQELDLSQTSLKIKENKDGIKVVYNEG